MSNLQTTIEQAWDDRANISPANASKAVRDAVNETIAQLDQGTLRVSEKIDGQWITHQWAKKAVLLSFRLQDNAVLKDGYSQYYDKVPSKFAGFSAADFQAGGYRVVPPAAARHGSYIAKNVILMPSFVNIDRKSTRLNSSHRP